MTLTELRKNIVDIVNQSDLPIDGIYFVMKDIMNEIVGIYNQQQLDINQNNEELLEKKEEK